VNDFYYSVLNILSCSVYPKIQSVHKRMVQFQIHFSPYMGKTYTVSSGNSPSFSCTTSSWLLMLTVEPRGQFPRWCRSRKKVFCVLRFEVSRSVITVQREFCARFRTAGAHRKPFPAATPSWKLAPRPRSKHEKRTAVAHEKLGQLSLLTVYVLPV
jgi:hypothetical protein